MNRMLGAIFVGLLAAGLSQAHFPFILPDDGGGSVKVVFSDTLAPDTEVKIEKLEATKLFVREPGGKDVPVEWKKGNAALEAKVPGNGPRTVFGVTEYGVLQKGDAKPFRLTYYPKAVIGGGAAKPIGDPLKVEIVAETQGGKTRFQVLAGGKPVAEAETTVLLPGDMKKMLKTDKDGFTPSFEQTGRFGVFARVSEATSGEFAGKKFDEVRSYATLVIDVK
jgi:uncharacterized GH25 family protein